MPRIKEIDGLRTIAVLSVVAWHYIGASADSGSGSLLWRATIFGRSGVDLFFVLSGYLITSILLRNRDSSTYFSTFYARRAFRILPIYYVIVAIYVLGRSFNLSRTLFDGPIPAWTYVVGVQNVWMTLDKTYGAFWLGGTWSLAIEEQFYLLFPLLVSWLSLRRLRLLLLGFMIVCPLLRIWAYGVGEPLAGYGYYFLTPFRADNLAVGALVAWYEQTGTSRQIASMARRTLVVSAAFFPVYAILIGRHTDFHMALWGHTYLALFYGSLLFMTLQNAGTPQLAWLRGGASAFFARISYALYLVHTSVLLALSIALGVSRDVSSWPGRLLAAMAFAVSVGICWLSYRLLERHLIGFAHRHFTYLKSSRPGHAVQSVDGAGSLAAASRLAHATRTR